LLIVYKVEVVMRAFNFGIAATFAIGVAGSAFAADMPVKAPYQAPATVNWNGCYIGGDVGSAWSRQDVDSSVPAISDQAPGYATLKDSSIIGGAYVGCNWQSSPSIVLGIEGDWSATDLNGTGSFPNLSRAGVPAPNGGITYSDDTKWLASVRGRAGFLVMPNVLLYGTGGVAFAHTQFGGADVLNGGCPNCGTTSFSDTQTGWAAGAGAEWAPWNDHWRLRVEYLHYGFGGESSTPPRPGFPAAPPTFTWHDLNIDEVRTGVAFQF
jgi:outer membrane immunogenic protein